MPLPAREPRPPPELGHEPLATTSPGLLSNHDGFAWDPEALSACKWESIGHSLHRGKEMQCPPLAQSLNKYS
jgi:hypothetical protein